MRTKLPKASDAKKYFEAKCHFSSGPMEIDRTIRDNPDQICIIDVRDREDYERGHLPGAINVPEEDWETTKWLEREKMNVVYCYSQTCHLAAKACLCFASQGYPVMEMEGGFESWKEHGLKIEEGRKATQGAETTAPAYHH